LSKIVKVHNLSVSVNNHEIIKDLSIEISEGEIICVTGSTGAGKTTFLRVVTGLIPELYKDFKIDGEISIFGLSPSEALHRGLVAYVPQDVYSFFIGSTPREELAAIGIESCCSDIDLDKDIDRLSDGQLYRFLLNTALVGGAKVIAIDEPLSHIDWWSVEKVFEYLKSFAESNKLVIIVAEHRIDLIKNFCSSIVKLDASTTECPNLPKLGARNNVTSTAIELRDVHITYNYEHILKGITMSIGFGEAIAITGRNGCGKTTLLNILAGIAKPSKGFVNISKRTKLFIVPQNPVYWFPSASVEDVAKLFARKCKFDGNIENVLSVFNLDRDSKKNVYSLSVGKARLLSMALAHISNSSTIIVDEPTLGLDCKSKKILVDIFNKFLENEKTVIVATHDLSFAKLFNTVYILEKGKLMKGQ